MSRRRAPAIAALVAVAASASSIVAAAPEPGRFDGELCVATRAGEPPTCGAADVELGRGGRVSVRVADIVYRLDLGRAELEVTTMHGAMQIDEFRAAYRWSGDTLEFADPDKDVRYEVRFGVRKARRS